MAPGETRSVTLDANEGDRFRGLSVEIVPYDAVGETGADPEKARIVGARRSIVDHLDGGWEAGNGVMGRILSGAMPMILTFQSEGPLEVSVGGEQERIGETLYLLQASAQVTGPVTLTGSLLQHAIIDTDSVEAYESGTDFYLGRGTMTLEYRASGLSGNFLPTGLDVRFGTSNTAPTPGGDELLPLPAAEQPDPDAPLAVNPGLDELQADLPRLQLFDVRAQTWVEFEAANRSSYAIADPPRWIDDSGKLLVRLVARRTLDETFGFAVRMTGSVE
jgi:hypothetical protein